jgi:hypothetical protein
MSMMACSLALLYLAHSQRMCSRGDAHDIHYIQGQQTESAPKSFKVAQAGVIEVAQASCPTHRVKLCELASFSELLS